MTDAALKATCLMILSVGFAFLAFWVGEGFKEAVLAVSVGLAVLTGLGAFWLSLDGFFEEDE